MRIKRTLLRQIKDHLSAKEISLIVGPRQAGKTTLMRLLEKSLQKQGERTVFFNLDIEGDKPFFTSQEGLLRKIRLEIGRERGYVFIDEIQRRENAGLFLKGIYDRETPYKFVVSGSGSLELKEKIHESLAGRKRVFYLNTLSFEEFVNFKTDYGYEDRLEEFFAVEKQRSYALLDEYLNFGGYPRVVLAETTDEKRRIIDEIYQSYLERDIKVLLNVQKTEAFTNLVRILASQAGQIVNHAELSSTLGISFPTLKEYLWYLEKTFILSKVRPYFRNKGKEIAKAPVFYFADLGFRNYALGGFGHAPSGFANAGFLFQNAVYQMLREKTLFSPWRISYWRTKGGAEVDFVLNTAHLLLPFEVKFKKMERLAVSRSLLSFIQKYTPETGYIVNLSERGDRKINHTTTSVIPFFDLISLSLPRLK